jgi:hypothetical protein
MAVYTKMLLSGSTNGRAIKVAAMATPGTLLHTAVAGAADLDEIFVYAANMHTADVELTVEWGGVAAPDDQIVVTVPYDSGLILVAPGLLLQNSLVVRAFAAVADVVCVHGYVHRIA